MSEKLLGCPFCGSEALGEMDDALSYRVRCTGCGIRTPLLHQALNAIKKWNTRTPASDHIGDANEMIPIPDIHAGEV